MEEARANTNSSLGSRESTKRDYRGTLECQLSPGERRNVSFAIIRDRYEPQPAEVCV